MRAEAYGPVVLAAERLDLALAKERRRGLSFRLFLPRDRPGELSRRQADLRFGKVLNSMFSNDVDDEIYSTFQFSNGLYGQLATNWSDESFRKMSLKLSFWGTNGRINVDRQELQVYIRSLPQPAEPGSCRGMECPLHH